MFKSALFCWLIAFANAHWGNGGSNGMWDDSFGNWGNGAFGNAMGGSRMGGAMMGGASGAAGREGADGFAAGGVKADVEQAAGHFDHSSGFVAAGEHTNAGAEESRGDFAKGGAMGGAMGREGAQGAMGRAGGGAMNFGNANGGSFGSNGGSFAQQQQAPTMGFAMGGHPSMGFGGMCINRMGGMGMMNGGMQGGNMGMMNGGMMGMNRMGGMGMMGNNMMPMCNNMGFGHNGFFW